MAKKTRKPAKKKKATRKTVAKKKKTTTRKPAAKKKVAGKKTAKKKAATKKKSIAKAKKTARKASKKVSTSKRKAKRAPTSRKTARPKKRQKQEFPGYKPYPASEDIMNKTTKVERVDTDLDQTNKSGRGVATNTGRKKIVEEARKDAEAASLKEEKEKIKFASGNDADVKKEDIEALGPKDLSMDMGDDEQLKNRKAPVDFSGKDLDVPGSEDDDAMEDIGSEDEENNPYSLGSERHEDEDNNAGVRKD